MVENFVNGHLKFYLRYICNSKYFLSMYANNFLTLILKLIKLNSFRLCKFELIEAIASATFDNSLSYK